MTTQTQIVALSSTGALYLWHETQEDFVQYAQEVPNTSEDEFVYALFKAKQYPAIKKVWMETINAETGELI